MQTNNFHVRSDVFIACIPKCLVYFISVISVTCFHPTELIQTNNLSVKYSKIYFFGLLVNLPQGDMSPDDGQDGFDGNPDLFVL